MRRLFRSDGLNPRPPLWRRVLDPVVWHGVVGALPYIPALIGTAYLVGAWMIHFARSGAWWWTVVLAIVSLAVVIGARFLVPAAVVVLGGLLAVVMAAIPDAFTALLP